jgi:hypothetical protein
MVNFLNLITILRPKILFIFGSFLYIFSFSIFNTYIPPPLWLEEAFKLPFWSAVFPIVTAIVLLFKPEYVLSRGVVYPYFIEASIVLLIGLGLTLIGLLQIERTKRSNLRHNITWTFVWLGIISLLYVSLRLLFTLIILAFSYTRGGVIGGLITLPVPMLLYPSIVIMWFVTLFIVRV